MNDQACAVVVSVLMPTYKHAPYIKQAVESILIQATDFEFELLIGDDCSPDKTPEIIAEIINTHPKGYRIRYFRHEKNVGMQANDRIISQYITGKYVALCDADDYWTDPLKLQKQVDLLEQNETCNYVFTKNRILTADGAMRDNFPNDFKLPQLFDLHFLVDRDFLPATQTVMFRSSAVPKPYPEFFKKHINADWALLFVTAYKGKIGFINENTAVYREGVGIISNTNKAFVFKDGIELNKQLNKFTNYEYDYYIGNFEYQYQRITFAYLEDRHRLRALYYFFGKLFYSAAKNRTKYADRDNWNFIKHSVKLIVKSFSPLQSNP